MQTTYFIVACQTCGHTKIEDAADFANLRILLQKQTVCPAGHAVHPDRLSASRILSASGHVLQE